ncbi:MAG TPA: hypothetical protein VEH04_09100 [Verrucomicrobiae bacterium]|nr:hypothetical protein [Verrucomicrobiae bacterium]
MRSAAFLIPISVCAAALTFAGCATRQNSAAPGKFPARYKADDGRNVVIGSSTASNSGWNFKHPHLAHCWIADGFDFTGYDALYIAPVKSTATFHDDEKRLHEWTAGNYVEQLSDFIRARQLFATVVTNESALPANARYLTMENTIVEYSKGGGAARYFAGMYGAGQPVLRVQGRMTDAGQEKFAFDVRRSGVSSSSRMWGGFMKDEDVQVGDIRSMTLDLSDFMAAIAGKYTSRHAR